MCLDHRCTAPCATWAGGTYRAISPYSAGDLTLRNSLIAVSERIYLLKRGSTRALIVPHHDIAQMRRDGVTIAGAAFGAFLTGYGLTREAFAALRKSTP